MGIRNEIKRMGYLKELYYRLFKGYTLMDDENACIIRVVCAFSPNMIHIVKVAPNRFLVGKPKPVRLTCQT